MTDRAKYDSLGLGLVDQSWLAFRTEIWQLDSQNLGTEIDDVVEQALNGNSGILFGSDFSRVKSRPQPVWQSSSIFYERRVTLKNEKRVETVISPAVLTIGIALLLSVWTLWYVFSGMDNFILNLIHFGVLSLLAYETFMPGITTQFGSIASLTAWRAKPFAPAIIFPTLFITWLRVRSVATIWFVDAVTLVLACILLGFFYNLNALGIQEIKPGYASGMIPLTVLVWTLTPLLLFTVFAFQPGRLYHRIDLLVDTVRSLEPSQTTASLTADLLGSSDSLSAVSAMLADFTRSTVLIIAVLVSLFYVLCTIQARREIRLLRVVDTIPLSKRHRILTVSGFLVGNVSLLAAIIPVSGFLYYGLTGSLPISPEYFPYTEPLTHPIVFDLSTTTPSGERVFVFRSEPMTTKKLIQGSYAMLEALFQDGWPLQPRVSAVLFYLIIFWPLLFIALGWLGSNVLGMLYKVAVLARSERLDRELDSISDDVTVLVDPKYTEVPVARPLGFLFFQRWIVVSEAVREGFERHPDALEALLVHEQYHIENADPAKNSLASLLSIGLGGRNTLLMLFNYPEVERAADDAAADRVGHEALRIALDRFEILQQRATGQTPVWGAAGFRGVDWGHIRDQKEQSALSVYRTWKSYTDAPGELLFGRVLLDTAHLSPGERIERLQSDKE